MIALREREAQGRPVIRQHALAWKELERKLDQLWVGGELVRLLHPHLQRERPCGRPGWRLRMASQVAEEAVGFEGARTGLSQLPASSIGLLPKLS